MQELYFIHQPMAPLRATASDAAEMVSQLLFGDIVALQQRDRQWMQVRNRYDDYLGWVDEKALLPISEAWLADLAGWALVQEDRVTLHATRAGATLPLRLELGMRVPLPRTTDLLAIGDWSVPVGALRTAPAPVADTAAVEAWSAHYLGVPYLWGGRSLAGIDCSGLTQQVFGLVGVALPRDARDQALVGHEVSWADRRQGDLAFFHNASGRVTHVGIVLASGHVRHASGHVHDAVLTAGGIIGKYTGEQTHTLCSIKRII